MDADYLISAVFKRPSIWDKRRKDHGDRNVVDNAWKDISNEMNIEDAALRRKWKNLRDYFGREYSKIAVLRSGDNANGPFKKSKWHYFSQLLFLKDIMTPRQYYGSVGSLATDDSDAVSQANDTQNSFQDSINSDPESKYNPASTEPEQSGLNITDVMASSATSCTSQSIQALAQHIPQQDSGQKKRKSDTFYNYERLLDLEDLKIQLPAERSQNDDSNDSDLLFLKSLLPYIKRIPEEKMMSFRSRLQLLVDEYAFRS